MTLFQSTAGPGDDGGLETVVSWFRAQDGMASRFGSAIRKSFDEVFDGQRTGRYSLEQLSKVEKTYIGTKVEIVVQSEFGLQRGRRMDYLVVEEEVDAKWSMRSGGWMIPTEAVGELCLCMTANDAASSLSVGVVRASDERLRTAKNKDQKRYLNEHGVGSMAWLVNDGVLPENLLLRLRADIRDRILDYDLSGQGRVNALFRLVQSRIVRREVVLTIAQQDDGPKRVRDARHHLRAEGILILGHQGGHPEIARSLGLAIPPKGSWISCRVVKDESTGPNSVVLGDATWRRASEGDAPDELPASY